MPMRDNNARVITHTAYAKVARAMGYTVQGLIELCEQSYVNPVDWTTIGLTRNGVAIEGECGRDGYEHRQWRVAALFEPESGRYVFSIGPNAFGMADNVREAQRIRAEAAQAIVNAIHRNRNAETRSIIRAARREVEREEAEKAQLTEAVSSPETMIIWPVAPRDPRGI